MAEHSSSISHGRGADISFGDGGADILGSTIRAVRASQHVGRLSEHTVRDNKLCDGSGGGRSRPRACALGLPGLVQAQPTARRQGPKEKNEGQEGKEGVDFVVSRHGTEQLKWVGGRTDVLLDQILVLWGFLRGCFGIEPTLESFIDLLNESNLDG